MRALRTETERQKRLERIRVHIQGVVQGVGFRPFLHRLTQELGVNGFIRNTSSGVELEAEGSDEALEALLRRIPQEAPALAVIEEIRIERGLPEAGYTGFAIRGSEAEEGRNTLISPDIGICPDCLRELKTPGDRRYRYPFINCTNCGPRFTILREIPYDRANTSMRSFPMCPECAREYHDITDRRYHAQPDCCEKCGPEVFYTDAEHGEAEPLARGENAVEMARSALKEGKILAVKGLGGMHLACRAEDEALVRLLRRRKERDEKPFALMCRDLACAEKLCEIGEEEKRILTGPRRPIVLLKKKPGAVSAAVSENGSVGIMLPYTPLHVLLFGDDIEALVMTSANLSDTPIVYKNAEALERLHGIADGFLLHDREIETRCDDSLCRVLDGREYFFRRSRGYVPFPVFLKKSAERSVLACGAEQKASFCLTKGHYAFLPQHIGDLKNYETFSHYEEQIRHFERLFGISPEVLACDRHPDYLSTEYAEERSRQEGQMLVRVQHHHAHLAACMADNGLEGNVIGLIWDGTGLGTDGTVWGGECLIGGYGGYRRFASIRPIPLLGGDRVTKELDRVAFALLEEAGCGTDGLPNAEMCRMLLQSGLPVMRSSGMGRLFDGAAAILGIKTRASYEGQGAVLLEAAAAEEETRALEHESYEENGILYADWRPAVRQMRELQRKGTGADALAARFLNLLEELAAEQCIAARKQSGERRVVLSGGCFQNARLMERLPARLQREGFEVYYHRNTACSDEGLSLGQARIAQEQSR